MVNEKHDLSSTSTETAKQCCRDIGVDPELWWGHVNDYILDGYHEAADESRARIRELESEAARLRQELEQLRADNATLRGAALKAGREMGRLRRELRTALYGEVA